MIRKPLFSSLKSHVSSLSLLVVAFLLIAATTTDDHYDYETDFLTPSFHRDRREALRNLMPDSSVAIFFSNPVCIRSNDVEYDFHEDPNLYYLSGLTEPNSALVLFHDNQKFDTVTTNEILYVQDRDPSREVWTGRRLGKEGAKSKLGVKTVALSGEFGALNVNWKKFKKVFFFPLPTVANDPNDPFELADMVASFKRSIKGMTNIDTTHLEQYMGMMRQIKEPAELVLLRKAIQISGESHIDLMKAIEPDMTEYKAQAIVEYGFKMRGAESVGYPSICGAGENSCILHYTSNRKSFDNGNMIVVDAGAEYHGYSADITRTLPVNGKFSPEQKLIYDIVLDAQAAGIKECMSGKEFHAPNAAAIAVVTKRLKALGIITKDEDYRKYFFHGTSHYLGLDVHDAGQYGKLEPGNVITVEPGIYVPEGSPCDPKWWNIGVRIEDDVLITDGQPEVLSGFVPRTTVDIEKMMAQKSFLNGK